MELIGMYADAWVSGLLPVAEIGFRGGFVDTVRLCDGPGTTEGEDLVRFLALPIAARIRRLVLGPVGFHSCGQDGVDSQALVRALCEHGSPTLRDLEIIDADYLPAIPKLPALERLTVRDMADMQELFDGLASESLRELRVFGDYIVSSLDGLQCPRLEVLELRTTFTFDDDNEDDEDDEDDKPAKVEMRLRRLTFMPTYDVEETITRLLREPFASTLEEVVICTAADSHRVRAAVAAAAPHIARVVVEPLAPPGGAK
jgi:hypothetical protein